MQTVIAIAAGGALGAVMRHSLNGAVTHVAGTGFPFGIFIANIAGSFLMGVMISVFAHFWDPSQAIKAFLTVGLLGAFTTFSTFSLDAVILIERGNYGPAAFYIIGSVSLALVGLILGMHLVRGFIS